MDKSQIDIYSTTIAALMNETIYYIDNVESYTPNLEEKVISQPISFSYLGKNHQKVLILLYNSKGTLSKSDLDFLGKIITSLSMTMDDIALLNYARYDSSNLEQLKAFFDCEKVISFALPLTSLASKNTQELTITDVNGIYFLNIPDSLSVINADKTRKLQLWNLLKSLFNVK